MDVKFFMPAAKVKCVSGETLNSCPSYLSRAPGSTKAIKSEEGIGMLKAQRSMVVSAVTLAEDLE